jgi:hypothetical protein
MYFPIIIYKSFNAIDDIGDKRVRVIGVYQLENIYFTSYRKYQARQRPLQHMHQLTDGAGITREHTHSKAVP